MHTSLSISLFVIVITVISKSGSSQIKGDFLDGSSQPQSTLEEDDVVLDALNISFSSFLPFNVNFSRKNENLFENTTALNNIKVLIASNEEKGKLCLKNVTQCMLEDAEYNPTLEHLTRYLFTSLPPFELSSVEGVTQKCKKSSYRYLQALKRFKLWALKMYDANGKIPSGLLNGNVNQFGDFDLCLSATSEDQNIRGKYCLASMQVEIPQSPYLSAIHSLLQAHYALKSNLHDPGHRVPRFSSINWALCVPHSCTPKDVELGLTRTLRRLLNGTDLDIHFEVDPTMCQYFDSKSVMPMSAILASGFFAAIILIAVTASIYDYCGGDKHEIFLAFSLRRTLSSLFSMERPSNDIEAVHGIKLINALMLLFAHKCMALFFVPYVNRTEMSQILGKPWTVIGRAASLYTDPFIMISGTLTAYSLIRKLQRSNKIDIGAEYVSRLFRIVPTLGALILFCTFVLPWLNSGPLWNLVITHHATNCKQHWWRNMLFIHNYFGFRDMCLTHTHHVGIDTQLFFVSPFIVLMIWRWPKRGLWILLAVATTSTIMRYYATYSKRLSNYIHFGTSIEQLFDTADNMYILPSHRATVYIMGILLGYSLQQYKNAQLNTARLQFGNTLAILSFCISFFGPAFMGDIDYVYNPLHAALYAAFAPILWCFAFGWIIFTTHIGHKGFIGRLLSWRGFLISTRLSYAIYLTQFPVFFYNVGVIRAPEEYGFFYKHFNLGENAWILFFSIALTVLFDSPFQALKNIVIKKHTRPTSKEIEQKIK